MWGLVVDLLRTLQFCKRTANTAKSLRIPTSQPLLTFTLTTPITAFSTYRSAPEQHEAASGQLAACDLTCIGFNLRVETSPATIEAAFVACMPTIRLPVQPHSVQAVGCAPRSCGGRGCARLGLPAALAQAALAAAPRLRCFRPDVSLDVWHSREERRWVQTAIATQPAPGRADMAAPRHPGGNAADGSVRAPLSGTSFCASRPRQNHPCHRHHPLPLPPRCLQAAGWQSH